MRARHLFAVLTCLISLSIARAQEPLRLPEPPAKALPKNGAPPPAPVKEEVKGRVVPPHGAPAPRHDGHAAAYEAQFGGYPYSGGWHAGYHHPLWDRPVALLVPPTSNYQTIWNWQVGGTQITPIPPQYVGPGYGVPFESPSHYQTTPYWPWDTRQFGVYYIRGPW